MQYAFVDGSKVEARKGLKGICIGCGNEMIPKCGESKLHHWAHRVLTKCDSWWERETIWHREWKDQFPESYREISFYDEIMQEYHRADVHTPEGLTIEFQNSSLSIAELQSREAFYQKLIWVINGLKFKGFSLGKSIPDPKSAILKEYELSGGSHVVYTRKSERLFPPRLKDKFTLEHPAFNHIQASNIHYSFDWKHAHKAWLQSNLPVFIDLGGHFLYWLKKREQASGEFFYLQMVSKLTFINRYHKHPI